MRLKRLVIIFIIFIFTTLCCLTFPFILRSSEKDFNEEHTCPACYGFSLCPDFLHDDIKFIAGSKIRLIKYFNTKNVYFGKLNYKNVIAKKLAHNWELENLDVKLCKLVSLGRYCNPKVAVQAIFNKIFPNQHVTTPTKVVAQLLSFIKGETSILQCHSERLVDLFLKSFINNENIDLNTINIFQIVYILLVNPESLMLQAFPSYDGWPFPEYLGACGRVIVENNVGPTLFSILDEPWQIRLHVSYQLLQMAYLFNNNHLNFTLYFLDVKLDNFAIRSDGSVFLIDVESILVVDQNRIIKDKSPGWNVSYTSRGEGCSDCLSYDFDSLCTHLNTDHNYYAICKSLLVPNSYSLEKGLLYDIPEDLSEKSKLISLLDQCAMPTLNHDRISVIPKLMQLMKSLL